MSWSSRIELLQAVKRLAVFLAWCQCIKPTSAHLRRIYFGEDHAETRSLYMDKAGQIENDQYIKGGTPISALPYVGVFQGGLICGASLIWYDIALTAAHCVSSSVPSSLRFNSTTRTSGGTVVSVRGRTIYPGWTGAVSGPDLAVIYLNKMYTNLSVVTLNQDPNIPNINGQALFAMGFGETADTGVPSSNLLGTGM